MTGQQRRVNGLREYARDYGTSTSSSALQALITQCD